MIADLLLGLVASLPLAILIFFVVLRFRRTMRAMPGLPLWRRILKAWFHAFLVFMVILIVILIVSMIAVMVGGGEVGAAIALSPLALGFIFADAPNAGWVVLAGVLLATVLAARWPVAR